MTSEIPSISNFILKHDQPLSPSSCPNGTLPHRLLSPIAERSADIHSTCSAASKKSPDPVLTKENATTDELTGMLVQRLHHYMSSFQSIQTYLDTLQQRFTALSIILEYLRREPTIHHVIEPIETRLQQMRAKRNQIDHLLNQSSITTIMQRIAPFAVRSQTVPDYGELSTSIRLNLNQKSTLIDHLKNEYRYNKYQVTEYASRLRQRRELLIELTNRVAQFIVQHDRILQQVNSISIINEHHRQYSEFTDLSNEYEQLRRENHLLTLQVQDNLAKCARLPPPGPRYDRTE